MIIALQRHAAYTRLQTLNNADDKVMSAASSVVRSDIVILRTAVDNRLQLVPPEQHALLGRYVTQATNVWQESKTNAGHQLSADVARYSGKVTAAFQKSVARTYSVQIEKLEAATLSLPENSSTVKIDKGSSASSTLTLHRAKIMTRAAGYEAAAPAIASLLASQVDLLNRDAVEHGYPNAAAQKYNELGITSASLGVTLDSFAAEAPAYRRYQQLLSDHAKKKLGLNDLKASDLALSNTAMSPISLDEARPLILEALAPLGAGQRMRRLLDPANGRLGLERLAELSMRNMV